MPKKWRVGIIGSGFGLQVHFPGFQSHPRFEVVGLASVRGGRARELEREYGVARAYDSWEQMLREADLDVVSVTSSPDRHREMVLAALGSGRHVLCEKPFALNLDEARQMLAAAERSGRVAVIDFEFRFYPARYKFRELIRSGVLGEVIDVLITWNWPDYNRIAARPMSWWLEADKGGGMLGALASHLFDSIRWWFGDVTDVCGSLRILHPEHRYPDGRIGRSTADDTFSGLFRLAGGAEGTIRFLHTHGNFGLRVEATGREGTLIMLEDALRQQRVWVGGRGEEPREVELEPLEHEPPADAPEYVQRHLPIFVSLLDRLAAKLDGEDVPDLPTFYDGAWTQTALDAFRQSAAECRWVAIPRV